VIEKIAQKKPPRLFFDRNVPRGLNFGNEVALDIYVSKKVIWLIDPSF